MAKFRLASNRKSITGSFGISQITVAIQPNNAIASSQQMKLLPNQSSICPRSSAISRVVARNTRRVDKLAERLADETRRQIEVVTADLPNRNDVASSYRL